MPQARPSPPEMLALLRGVSRSFYVSIRLLPAPLRRPVAVAYLLARAADTLADTAGLPSGERREKLEALAAAVDGRLPAARTAGAWTASLARLQHDAAERDLLDALPMVPFVARRTCAGGPRRHPGRAAPHHTRPGTGYRAVCRRRDAPCAATHPGSWTSTPTWWPAAWASSGPTCAFAMCRRLPRCPGRKCTSWGELTAWACSWSTSCAMWAPTWLRAAATFPPTNWPLPGCGPRTSCRTPTASSRSGSAGRARAHSGLELGIRYADAVDSRRVRAASALPALLGLRTLALLRAAGPQRLRRKVKVPRHEVRSMLARLLFTLAGRAPLQALFGRLRDRRSGGEWDNPRP